MSNRHSASLFIQYWLMVDSWSLTSPDHNERFASSYFPRLPGARYTVAAIWGEEEEMVFTSTPNNNGEEALSPTATEDTANPDNQWTTREQFLQRLGISGDPFIYQVAEQELSYAQEAIASRKRSRPEATKSTALAFFVPPVNRNEPERSLIETLRRAGRTGFVFGELGSGKTSLRLALEAECRQITDDTLVVTCVMPAGTEKENGNRINWTNLARNLAVDAFIQAVEQFNPNESSSDDKPIASLLGTFLALGGPNLRRVANKILQLPSTEPATGLGAAIYWTEVNRFPMRHVYASSALKDLIKHALQISKSIPTALTGAEKWSKGIAAAETWGFTRILLLFDGVDNASNSIPEMVSLLQPLLQQTTVWRTRNIEARYFLPAALQPAVQELMRNLPGITENDWFEVDLVWTDDALRELIKARFRALGSRRVGFADLGSPDLGDSLDTLLLRQAAGSPRHLLQLISRLINHMIMASSEQVTPPLWSKMLQEEASESQIPSGRPINNIEYPFSVLIA